MADIVFGASTHGQSPTCPKPSGVADGSLLVAGLLGIGVYGAAPAGWTKVKLANDGGSYFLGLYYRIISDADAEPASYTFTGWFYSGMTVLNGVDPDDTLSGTATSNTGAGTPIPPISIPAVTTERDGAAVIGLGICSRPTASIAGLSQLWNEAGSLVLHGETQAVAGSTGTHNLVTTNVVNAGSGVGILAAFNPAPAVPATIYVTGTISINLAIGIG